MFQGHPFQILHGDEGLGFMFADFVDRTDIRMIQSRRSASLAAEAFQSVRLLRHIVRKKFKGDEAAKLGVLGLVDNTHTAAAKLLDDAVVRDGLTDHTGANLTSVKQASQLRSGISYICEKKCPTQ